MRAPALLVINMNMKWILGGFLGAGPTDATVNRSVCKLSRYDP
jgi:hypothetical protein